MTLQDQIDKMSYNAELNLRPGEYEGPIYINKPCVIEGSLCTIWCREGPAIEINHPNVTLKNLNVEITGRNPEKIKNVAVLVHNQLQPKLKNVSIKGDVEGIQGESEKFDYPHKLDLGELSATKTTVKKFMVSVPVPCEICSDVTGLSFFPKNFGPGTVEIEVHVNPLKEDAMIYGNVYLSSKFKRRISVTGHVKPSSETESDHYGANPFKMPLGMPLPTNAIRLQKGQRVDLTKTRPGLSKVCLELEWAFHEAVEFDVDASMFLLDENGKVISDSDLIFYNNSKNEAFGVELLTGGGNDKTIAKLDLTRIPPQYTRIAVTLSIYDGEQQGYNFSNLSKATLQIFNDENREDMFIYELRDKYFKETALVVAEIYRHSGEWKLNPIGSGFVGGLKSLCGDYGVRVE